jgi:uncharacterized heparinase superfamily protein
MDAREIAWRAAAAARTAMDRARFRVAPPGWSRAALLPRLAASSELAPVRSALAAHDWNEAHAALARHVAAASRRFVITPSDRAALAARLAVQFPDSAEQAAARADRLLAGEFDLLGYRRVRFTSIDSATSSGADLDWSFDPIAGRGAPRTFSADVPYLDAGCGDHKVIWEVNRHQHWMALGRAYWLTGRPAYRARVIEELASWMRANPPLRGVNWASMLEIGFRALSWLWAINFFAAPSDDDAVESPWLVDLLLALDRQLTHVERNLSYYFSPNTHLLGEALALYVCGRALPELAASPRREALGRRILVDEIERQIAADGGHVERSTHYHRYTLDFYALALAIARITGDDAAGLFQPAVERLASALRLLADDTGRVPHLGDDDGGMLLPLTGRAPDDVRDSLAVAAALTGRGDLQIGATPEECVWLLTAAGFDATTATQLPARSAALPDTGYFVSRSATEHIVIDGGPHGFRNGGHAHADALSLTLSVRGVPLLIDPGTGCYTIDLALRDRMRSTALHNTLVIDDRPQSIPGGPFQWTHVASARVDAWRVNEAFDYFEGVHDGYSPLDHRRSVITVHGDLLVVADLVSGVGTHTAAAHWHLDPRWTARVDRRRVRLACGDMHLTMATAGGDLDGVWADAASGLGWCSPVYGSVTPTTTIRIVEQTTSPFWMVTALDLSGRNPIEAVEWLPVWAEAGATAHRVAVRIVRSTSIDYLALVDGDRERSWRVGDLESNARALCWRAGEERPIARLALIDGSLVRTSSRRGFLLALPRTVPDLHLDFADGRHLGAPPSGARIVVAGDEQPIEPDRAEPRP